MMQSYKYKWNLIDTDLLEDYHIINAPILLCDKKYALPKTNWSWPRMARLWPAYLMWHGPFSVHMVLANEKAWIWNTTMVAIH